MEEIKTVLTRELISRVALVKFLEESGCVRRLSMEEIEEEKEYKKILPDIWSSFEKFSDEMEEKYGDHWLTFRHELREP